MSRKPVAHRFPRFILTHFVAEARDLEGADPVAANVHVSRLILDYGNAFDDRETNGSWTPIQNEPDWIGAWTRVLQVVNDPERREGLFARMERVRKSYERLRRHPEPALAARVVGRFAVALADQLAAHPEAVSWRASDLLDFAHTAFARLHFAYDAAGRVKRVRAADVEWELVDRDVFAARWSVMTRSGPVRLGALRFASRKWRIEPSWPGPEGRSLSAVLSADSNIVAATNGGYYLYSEVPGAPHGALGDPAGLAVRDGVVLTPPIYRRPALLQDEQFHVHLRVVGLKGVTMRRGNMKLAARLVNRPQLNPGDIVFYNSLHGARTPVAPIAFAVYGRRVVETAMNDGVAIPLGGIAVAMHPGSVVPDRGLVSMGDEWEFDLPTIPGVGRVVGAVAGGPMILAARKSSVDWAQGDYGENAIPEALHPFGFFAQSFAPRLAAGVTEDHQVVIVAVEGRDFKHSVGMNLDSLARLMLDLGCVQAMNLDGGGGVGMIVRGDDGVVGAATRPIRSVLAFRSVKA
ncbi:MAG: phosphodiester glycosidase family protein [Deltaproteobacteria bacterium]|nr:phosphodiester glycosidase family protein [Deltaproteobacteria bacterium]